MFIQKLTGIKNEAFSKDSQRNQGYGNRPKTQQGVNRNNKMGSTLEPKNPVMMS